MNSEFPLSSMGSSAEISALIEVMRAADQRLEALLGETVDAVTDCNGQTLLLRRAQGRLRESDTARQAAILNALPAYIALLDARGVIVSVNDAWRQFADANLPQAPGPGQALGLNYIAVCDGAQGDHAAEAKTAAAGIRSVLSGDAPSFAFEYSCHSPTTRRWFLLNVTPLAGNPPTGAVATHTNITVRRQTEDALDQLSQQTERRERMLSTMLSSISDFTFILDRHGRFLFANQPLLDFWGLTAEQAEGKSFFDLPYLHDVATEMMARVLAVFETNKPVTGERPVNGPTGTTGFYEFIFSPASAEDGSVDFVVGTTRNITEQKRTEKVLLESEAEFRTLAEAMPQVVWITRADGGAGYFNRRWMEYTGLTLQESLGREWKKVMHPDDMRRAQENWELATATSSIHTVESRMRRADGVYRWWLIRAAPLLNAAGEVLKWFGTGTDIDELKTAELELSKVNGDLRQQSSELRTLFDLIPAMITFRDADNNCVRANQRAANFMGRPVEEIEGTSGQEVVPGMGATAPCTAHGRHTLWNSTTGSHRSSL